MRQGIGLSSYFALMAVLGPIRLEAQSTGSPGSFELGASADVFVDFPSELAQPYCEQKSGGVAAHGSYWPSRYAGVELVLLSSGGYGAQRCAFADLAPRPVGVPFERNVYADGDFGASLFTTNLAVVLNPLRGAPVSPIARAGMGRMWNKSRGLWFVGGGFRYQFGRHAMLMEVEWWSFEMEIRQETVIFEPDTGYQVLSARTFKQTESPYLIRVGWAIGVGR